MTTPLPSLRDLVDAGAHFGHRRSRSHPKAHPYVYAIRDRVLVVNLEKTLEKLEAARKAIEQFASAQKSLLFVGTKPQAKVAIKLAAEFLDQPYITHRWLGGMLTNFDTIRLNLGKLTRLEEVAASPEFAEFTKKERGLIGKRIERLNKIFGGLKKLDKLPDVLVVIDINEEDIAVREARAKGIPVIALVDTNANPELVTYPIPGNDDSRKTIEIILGQLTEAYRRGQSRSLKQEENTIVELTEESLELLPQSSAEIKTRAKKAVKAQAKKSVAKKTVVRKTVSKKLAKSSTPIEK
ncbi:30S ribosomal protein S2 [Candidatus Berkelbacteria bacterium]|nr:30S ribosomal protein S2 [Candidatus Berkelbacteria bacterium]